MLPQYNGQYRSEFAAQAVDTVLTPQLVPLGVEYIYVMPIIGPRIKVSSDDHHYSCEADGEGQNIENRCSVGREISRMLTAMICPL